MGVIDPAAKASVVPDGTLSVLPSFRPTVETVGEYRESLGDKDSGITLLKFTVEALPQRVAAGGGGVPQGASLSCQRQPLRSTETSRPLSIYAASVHSGGESYGLATGCGNGFGRAVAFLASESVVICEICVRNQQPRTSRDEVSEPRATCSEPWGLAFEGRLSALSRSFWISCR